MEASRLAGVTGVGGPGSGYAVGGRLVLTSAHVTGPVGGRIEVFRPGGAGTAVGIVVWAGTPGGRDDAALVLVDEGPHWCPPAEPVCWGRLVTRRPAAPCETWGVPEIAQRSGGGAVEAEQLSGTVNPGTGFVNNQYVLDLSTHPSHWRSDGTSPWGGLSGAAVFGDRVLLGVVSADRAHSAHSRLNVVPVYVLLHDASFRTALADHGAAAPTLVAAEFQDLIDRSHDLTARHRPATPAALLEPGRQVVPFHGRDALLADLRAWCTSDGLGIRLLHGPGGQGKTRLAQHLSQELGADGWTVLWPQLDATAGQVAELRHVVKPLLVVLDYADHRPGQLTALVEAAAEHPGTSPLKLLLLARTAGDWWQQACEASRTAEHHLAAARVQFLPPLAGDRTQRPSHFVAAVRALAAAVPLVDGLGAADPDSLPPRRLEDDAYGNALTLQMTALADLLDAFGPETPGTTQDEAAAVEDRLLSHERRYWRRSAAARNVALSTATLETALAAAHLCGAADPEDADLLWRRVPALADQPRDRRDAVTSWLADLYPPTAAHGQPWGALQPDRLAERQLGRILLGTPSLADRLLEGAGTTQIDRLLTVHSQAASHRVFRGALDQQLTELGIRHHRTVAPQIVATVLRSDHHEPLLRALRFVVDRPDSSLDDLIDLHDLLPYGSQRLADTAFALVEILTARYRDLTAADPSAGLPDLALFLSNYSLRLAELGRHTAALRASEEAVEHHRTLAETDPSTYLPELAMSLTNLSNDLNNLGRDAEALTVTEEAVDCFRACLEPEDRALAAALNNLAVRLGHAGRPDEALDAAQEALAIRRTLVAADPGRNLPDLAVSLITLSDRLRSLGRSDESLAAAREAVDHYRPLAEATPYAHHLGFTVALTSLATVLKDTGQHRTHLDVLEELTDRNRTLVGITPLAHLLPVVDSYHNISDELSKGGRPGPALTAAQEAVVLCRAIAGTDSAALRPKLATALSNLSVRLRDVGRVEQSVTAARESVALARHLADDADACLPLLAGTLVNLSSALINIGQTEETLPILTEAVEHYQALAHTGLHLPEFAVALHALAVRLGEAGFHEDALSAAQAAYTLHRALSTADSSTHSPAVAAALATLALSLARLGLRTQSMAATLEAIGIHRALADADPAAHVPTLARALNNHSNLLYALDLPTEGLAAIREAVTRYRDLAADHHLTQLPALALSLTNLALRLGQAGLQQEGLEAAREAVALYQALSEAQPLAFTAPLDRALSLAHQLS
ncbi:tetratricopeptide repeat protein [Kitasatospora griseola]|uniref:tetratricopeptide repeat protein n=1 Tax=Kitasatospora griseola TaxID=2064 RepID=UPI003423C4A4